MDVDSALKRCRLLAMDVDGVLTDGRVVYDDSGGESRGFHVSDGLGIAAVQLVGVRVAWITGRDSALVARRANELRIGHLIQGVHDKAAALTAVMAELGCSAVEVAYVGDDWNDIPALELAGVPIAVSNAAEEVRAAACWTTVRAGGAGAIREVCMRILAAQGKLDEARETYLRSLIAGALARTEAQ